MDVVWAGAKHTNQAVEVLIDKPNEPHRIHQWPPVDMNRRRQPDLQAPGFAGMLSRSNSWFVPVVGACWQAILRGSIQKIACQQGRTSCPGRGRRPAETNGLPASGSPTIQSISSACFWRWGFFGPVLRASAAAASVSSLVQARLSASKRASTSSSLKSVGQP